MCFYKEPYCKELAPAAGAGKSEIRGAGQQPGNAGGSSQQSGGEFLLFPETSALLLGRPCPGWGPPPPWRGAASTSSRAIADLQHFHEIPSSNPPLGVGLQGWLRSLDKLTHDAHCHRGKVDAQAREVSRPGDLPGAEAGDQSSLAYVMGGVGAGACPLALPVHGHCSQPLRPVPVQGCPLVLVLVI